MRNLEKQIDLISQATKLDLQQNIKVKQLDVTDQGSIHNFQLFLNEINRIDILINNAGYANGALSKKSQWRTTVNNLKQIFLELYPSRNLSYHI